MIKIIAKFTLKPSSVESVKKDIAALEIATRKEAGCISYQFFQDVNNHDLCFAIEEWESQEALNNHMNADHFKKFMAKASEVVAAEPELSVCTPLV